MPSELYLLVEGVEGHPVTDPWNPAANPARYLGLALKEEPAKDPDHVLEHYATTQQVVKNHGDIRRAVRRGSLTLIRSAVAKNHDAARAALIGGAK